MLVRPYQPLLAQSCPEARPLRLAVLGAGGVAAQGLALALFADDWWDTPRREFHVIWGQSASKGQDALLHGLSGYHITTVTATLLQWACVPPHTSAWLGGAAALLAQVPKELGDGFHNGLSATDLTWVAAGAALQAARRTWAPARAVSAKFNYWPSAEYRSNLPGAPGVFSDWAGQRYYLALHPGAAGSGPGVWPPWLGVAVGHGVPYWVSQPPERVWYVVLDLELGRLPVRAPWWSRVAGVLDQVHFPSPGLRVRAGRIDAGLF